MENTFFVFKDCVAVKWGGLLPPGAPPIYSSPADVLPYFEHIAPVARYNEKMNAFLMSLSAQNLVRLKKQFGDLRCTSGETLIHKLRADWKAFHDLKNSAIKIKAAVIEDLPPINYKVPPLAGYQHQGTVLLTQIKRTPLFADCGMGKCFMTLVSSEQHILQGVVARGKTLICGKIATLHSGWLEDAKKFTNLKVVCLWITGSYKRKEKILALLEEEADVYLINHEAVKIYEKELCAKRFEKVIIDESTVLKSFRSDREGVKGGSFGRSIMAVAEHADWRVIMSGTPAPNGPEDLWGQFKFLDPNGFLLQPKFHDFKKTYMEEVVFGKKSDPNAPRTWAMRPESTPLISDLVNPLAFRVRIRDHLHDLPPKTVMTRALFMTIEQEKHYKELAETFLTTIDDEKITVSVALSLFGKFRQITGGFLYDVEKNAHLLTKSNPKLEALDDLLYDEIAPDAKVVIFAQFEHEFKTLIERYKDCNPVSVYGGNSSKTNVESIDRFIKDPSVRLIFLHPKSAAHGITLTVAHYMVFYSISFSAEEDYQAVARIERASQKNAMFVYYLLCKGTIDDYMYKTIRTKTADQAKLIDGKDADVETMTQVQQFAEQLRDRYPSLTKPKSTRRDHG
jgi:SNF2 family DNA or RNA helicase